MRLGTLPRLALTIAGVVFGLHLLASLVQTATYDDVDASWSEALGLDHYADFEAGVADTLGGGLGRVKEGLGIIKGGLGFGSSQKLGNLYELVATSASGLYFDERTSLDRLRLTSTRVLGHGVADPDNLNLGSERKDASAVHRGRTRRHILVTGGFGSLGSHVVRDLLLGNGLAASTMKKVGQPDDWAGSADGDEEDVMVTLLDVTDRSADLNFLLQNARDDAAVSRLKGTDPRTSAFTSNEHSIDNFKRQKKLRIVNGDVRDQALMKSLLASGSRLEISQAERLANAQLRAEAEKGRGAKGHVVAKNIIPPVTGIIHLAAYSPRACRVNPVDCEAVESEGMDTILKSINREGQEVGMEKASDGSERRTIATRPWILVPRRGEPWTLYTNATNSGASTSSTGAAQDALREFSTRHPLHALYLHLPSEDSVIGDPYTPRYSPFPSLVESALSNLPLTTVGAYDSSWMSFLAIDDATRAMVQSARMLDLAAKKEYLRPMAFVAEIPVVGPVLYGHDGPKELVRRILSLTRSESPSSVLPPHDRLDPPTKASASSRFSAIGKKAKSAIGFTPTISLGSAVQEYISLVLQLQEQYLSSKVSVACSSAPSIKVLETGILGLTGCSVQLLTVIDGTYHTLGCSQGVVDTTTPLALMNAVPLSEGVRGVEILAEKGAEGKVDIQLRCPAVDAAQRIIPGEGDVVVYADTLNGGVFREMSKGEDDILAEWYTVDIAHRDSRSFTLSLPVEDGTTDRESPRKKLMLRDGRTIESGMIFNQPQDEQKPLLWRVNPICCSAKAQRAPDLWDFFSEDPLLTSQVAFPSADGATTLEESTLSLQRCKDLRAQHERISQLQVRLLRSSPDAKCDFAKGDSPDWTLKDATTCAADCAAPLPCIARSGCKCTRDRCGDPRADGPFPGIAYTIKKSYDDLSTPPDARPQSLLLKRMDDLPMDALIQPGARSQYFAPAEDLPKAHVVDVPETIDTHLESEACYQLDKSTLPYVGDHILIEALRQESVDIQDADFVVVPFYQGCYYNYLSVDPFQKLADTISFAETRIAATEHITASKIVIPFTHDFGSCTGWWPRLQDVLARSPPSPMDLAVAWQVNGDYNTRCVKPDRDVIVPAITRHSKTLFELYRDPKAITPSSLRTHLGFFAGGISGFGAIARTRIGCGRSGASTSSKILYQKFSPGKKYLGTLDDSKFCLLPRGIPAWTTRTFEAIYAGCIPAFIADRNIFPYQDILDYSRFSITIPENEAHRVEEILGAFKDDELLDMQAALLKVREAFVFEEGKENERIGPLRYALVDMAMRLSLQYPKATTC